MHPQTGSTTVVDTDRAWSIERNAIEPIAPQDRHGTPVELFRMWIGANVNYVGVVTGSLILAQLPSLWAALSAILVGNLLGSTVVGLCSIMGPRTGTAGIVGTRASFGQLGATLPMAISLFSALSWFSVQSIVATQSLEQLFALAGARGGAIVWLSIVLVLVAEIAIAVYGHATILAAEKWIGLVLAALFAGLVVFIVPHLSSASRIAAGAGGVSAAQWLATVGVVAALPAGWANFASDYSRYLPARTRWTAIALAAAAGQFVAASLCECIGVLFALALHGALGADPVSQLGAVLPPWYLVPFLIAVIVGGVSANVPNGYTAALGMMALRVPINRVSSLLFIAAFTLVVRVLTVWYGNFYDVYQQFLALLVYWTAPWAAIIITDHFLRRGQYAPRDLMTWGRGRYWYGNGVHVPGLIAFAVGVAASVACANSETFASPLVMRFFGGADLSMEAGLLVPAVLYYVLARRRGMRGGGAEPAPGSVRNVRVSGLRRKESNAANSQGRIAISRLVP